jgi:hypothetical protein
MATATPEPLRALEFAAVGAPITRCGVSLFPVHVHQSLPGRVLSGPDAPVRISESSAASVPTLSATTEGTDPVLLVEGETVEGGLQQRTLNVSVLLPAPTTLELPVSCVEAGRWSGAREFGRSATYATRRVRRSKHESVSRNLAAGGWKHADQGEVWRSIDGELDRLGVDSASRNLADLDGLYEQRTRRSAAVADLLSRGPLPGQCGVVVAHGGRVVAAEVLASPELLVAHWPAMVRAVLLDTPDEVRGRPSANRALRFLRRLASGQATEAGGVGLGRERHVTTPRLVGQVLTWDDAVVHASAFALAA